MLSRQILRVQGLPVRLFHLLHPGQNRAGDGLVRSVDREYFRHVALAFFEQHRGAMSGALLAEFIMQGLVERGHGSMDARVKLRSGEEQGDFGFFETGQAGSG